MGALARCMPATAAGARWRRRSTAIDRSRVAIGAQGAGASSLRSSRGPTPARRRRSRSSAATAEQAHALRRARRSDAAAHRARPARSPAAVRARTRRGHRRPGRRGGAARMAGSRAAPFPARGLAPRLRARAGAHRAGALGRRGCAAGPARRGRRGRHARAPGRGSRARASKASAPASIARSRRTVAGTSIRHQPGRGVRRSRGARRGGLRCRPGARRPCAAGGESARQRSGGLDPASIELARRLAVHGRCALASGDRAGAIALQARARAIYDGQPGLAPPARRALARLDADLAARSAGPKLKSRPAPAA